MARCSLFFILPTLGELVPGHLLLCPRKHYRSFGNCVAAGIRDIAITRAVTTARQWLKATTGTSCIAFEHEAVSRTCTAGACTDHAHLHILPMKLDLLPILRQNGLSFERITDYSELERWATNGVSYLFYEDQDCRKWACASPQTIPQQFFRRVVAAVVAFQGAAGALQCKGTWVRLWNQ